MSDTNTPAEKPAKDEKTVVIRMSRAEYRETLKTALDNGCDSIPEFVKQCLAAAKG